jgi:hypothetical protein
MAFSSEAGSGSRKEKAQTKFNARHRVTSAEFIQVFAEPRRGAPGLSA